MRELGVRLPPKGTAVKALNTAPTAPEYVWRSQGLVLGAHGYSFFHGKLRQDGPGCG
jgi:hypothetical protein